jgi:hypothetical protein
MHRYYASKGKQTHQQRVAEETAITHKNNLNENSFATKNSAGRTR